MTRTSPFGAGRAAALALLAVTLAPASAGAAGLYFADRGARPAGRGGAFIAGADDLGAIAYNPAGVFDAGSAFLFDASWVHFTSSYSREAIVHQVDPNTGKVVASFDKTFPEVDGSTPFLPIPTIVFSFIPEKHFVVAVGAWAPYAALSSYPDSRTAPQRYSLITLDGSLLVFTGAVVAFAPTKEWRIGLGAGALVGTFKSTVDFSGCIPERFFCAQEDPDWDVQGQVNAGPIIAPSGEAGVIFIPTPKWRAGVSVQLPVYVRTGATIQTRMPASPVFEEAKQVGDNANVAFDLPWNIRFGVEHRPIENLRVEVGGGFERWSMHDSITVTPDHVALEDVAGLPKDYFVPKIVIPRHFQDSFSIRAGGEYSFRAVDHDWEARAGLSFESSAVPPAYESVLTIDAPKVTPSLGASLHLKRFRFDFVYAHVFAFDVDVSPKTAKLQQIVPVLANPPRTPDVINGGQYSAAADIIGLGVNYQFDAPSSEFVPAANTPPEKPPAPAPMKSAPTPEPTPEP